MTHNIIREKDEIRMDAFANRVINDNYWENRAEGYSKVNQEELGGVQKRKWSEYLERVISSRISKEKRDINILDIGAGPGFISIILTEMGYKVTAADYAETMIEQAKKNAGDLADSISFVRQDAMNLSFEDRSFDVVVSRNLTWNLPDPKKAYGEWVRVLKEDGVLINFDANWYSYLADDDKRKAYDEDRQNVAAAGEEDMNIGENFDIMERIAEDLPLTSKQRPAWDTEILGQMNLGNIVSEWNVGESVYSDKELLNFSSTPMFAVIGSKN